MTTFAPTTLTDEALLERFRSGRDERAFALIVQRYADAVFATCLRILHDRARAEDATQETFFRLLRTPTAVEQSLGGWLHRAATTHCIDLIRRDDRRRHWEREHARQRAQLVEASTWQELSPHIDAALADLPDEQRWVLVQHYLRGRTMRDLAAEVGSSAPTLSRRHHAALESLRERLRKRGVIASVALIGALLTTNATSAAAPAAVTHELAKMSLLGAATSAEGIIGPPRWLVAFSLLLATGAVVGGLMYAWEGLPGWPNAGDEPAQPTISSVSPGVAASVRYIVLPGAESDLDADMLALVQDPATAGAGEKLAVVFRDNHAAALPPHEVHRLVESQTGEPLAVHAARQPVVTMDAATRTTP